MSTIVFSIYTLRVFEMKGKKIASYAAVYHGRAMAETFEEACRNKLGVDSRFCYEKNFYEGYPCNSLEEGIHVFVRLFNKTIEAIE